MKGEIGVTREEAIIILQNEQPHCGKKLIFTEEEKYEAYNIAIKAINQIEQIKATLHTDVLQKIWEIIENRGEF